jgi:hypothetical protein
MGAPAADGAGSLAGAEDVSALEAAAVAGAAALGACVVVAALLHALMPIAANARNAIKRERFMNFSLSP